MMPLVRGHGEGTVYRLPSGKYRVVISTPLGRRSRTGTDRADAIRKLSALRREYEAGIRRPRMTLGAYLASWLTDVQPTLAPATFAGYEYISRLHLIPRLGKVRLADLTVSQVRRYLHELPLHPQTVGHHRATLRRALADAVRDGMLPRNVAAMAQPPQVPDRERAWLDAEQMRTLFQSTEGDRLHAAWVVLGTTGLREAELLGLAWRDVDLTRATVTVRHTLHRRDGEWVLDVPKTRRSRRSVPLTDVAVAALRTHQRNQKAEQLAGGKPGREGLVFTTASGHPMHPNVLLDQLYAALAAAGLPRVGVHGLRHSVASILMALGVPIRVIADILGHSTTRITLDLYAHAGDAMQRDAADQMGRALGESAAQTAARAKIQ